MNRGETPRKTKYNFKQNKTKQNPSIYMNRTHIYIHYEKLIFGRNYTRLMTVVTSEK